MARIIRMNHKNTCLLPNYITGMECQITTRKPLPLTILRVETVLNENKKETIFSNESILSIRGYNSSYIEIQETELN